MVIIHTIKNIERNNNYERKYISKQTLIYDIRKIKTNSIV